MKAIDGEKSHANGKGEIVRFSRLVITPFSHSLLIDSGSVHGLLLFVDPLGLYRTNCFQSCATATSCVDGVRVA